jgi:putative transcriptional regulator
MSKNFISAKTTRDGRVLKILPNGQSVDVTPKPNALSAEPGPDDLGLTREELSRVKLVPRSKTMRRALGLTQEEFSERYRIPLGTLRDWEQGRTEPDAPARAYLRVIAKNPEMVRLALAS